MLLNKLSKEIYDSEGFQQEFSLLVDTGVSNSVGISSNTEVSDDVILRLLKSAIHFSGSGESLYKHTAHRIAIMVSKLCESKIDLYEDTLDLIWNRLGNFPTKDFILGSEDIQSDSFLSLFLRNYKEEQNSIELSNKDTIKLTDFQLGVWKSMSENDITTITAPTSAGKSFSLTNFLCDQANRNESFDAAYIVPTRALINQVSKGINEIAKLFKISDEEMVITSVPSPREEIKAKKCIYVLTQERLQILIQDDSSLSFDFMIIDEAQTVSDDSRGIILQSVLESIRARSPQTRILFGSPFTKNPEIFNLFIDGNIDKRDVVSTDESPVIQNIIKLATLSNSSKEVKVFRHVKGAEFIELGNKSISTELSDDRLKLPVLAYEIGKDEKNLVYADGPAQCENFANIISQLVASSEETVSEEIQKKRQEFSNFLRENIHKNYILADTVLNGVAFHYGNMPSIVRKTIEDYFDQDVLSYLVCTSTLLHGVNFPAKNLFMINPKKGANTPISSTDFWNLVGRAGRLGKDFEGNIYIIDHDNWDSDPVSGEKLQEVEPAYFLTISSSQPELFSFFNDKEHKSGDSKTEVLETTFQKLIKDFNDEKLPSTLNKALDNPDNKKIEEFKTAISNVVTSISLPSEIYEKHINISSYRQDELFKYFLDRIPKNGVERYLPKYPFKEGSSDSYRWVFYRIHRSFEKKPTTNKAHFFFAPWAHAWMSGKSLAELISRFHENKKKTAKRKLNMATSIRECLDLIESQLRFKYVKYTRCYNDILRCALLQLGFKKEAESLPNIPLFLELGASSGTMVNMIGLGLSRTTSSILNEKSAKKDMDTNECLKWLRTSNLEGMGVSNICIDEVKSILR